MDDPEEVRRSMTSYYDNFDVSTGPWTNMDHIGLTEKGFEQAFKSGKKYYKSKNKTMAKDANELRFVLPMIAICTGVVILFHWLYWPEFTILLRDGFFLVLYVVGVLLYLYFCYRSYVRRDVANANPDRWVTVLLAVFICAWVGGWCSQYRADKSDNIEYKYDKK